MLPDLTFFFSRFAGPLQPPSVLGPFVFDLLEIGLGLPSASLVCLQYFSFLLLAQRATIRCAISCPLLCQQTHLLGPSSFSVFLTSQPGSPLLCSVLTFPCALNLEAPRACDLLIVRAQQRPTNIRNSESTKTMLDKPSLRLSFPVRVHEAIHGSSNNRNCPNLKKKKLNATLINK